MALIDAINSTSPRIIRRVYMRRRQISGDMYETDWQDISRYVLDISNISHAVDDGAVNTFKQSGFTLKLLSDRFNFADENKSASMFAGFLTRHRTKIRVDITYIDPDENEYTYTVGNGFVDGEGISHSTDGTVIFPVFAPSVILEETPADYVNNGIDVDDSILWYMETEVSNVINALYNLEVEDRPVLHDYLEGLVNTPKHDERLDVYDFNSWSCWLALKEMAEASQSVAYVNSDFELVFTERAGTPVSQFTFSSVGANANIYGASNYNDGVKDLILRVQWLNTNPPIRAQEANITSRESLTNKYGLGNKVYTVENRLVLSSINRQRMVDDMYTEFGQLREQVLLEVKLCPQLRIFDTVTVHYSGNIGSPATTHPALWGSALWGVSLWGATGRRGVGGGIRISGDMVIYGISHDVKSFRTTLFLKRAIA